MLYNLPIGKHNEKGIAMSHHEWNDVMYGIELPNTYPDKDKLLAFIENHKEVFAWFTDENYFPVTHNDIDNFIDDYEDDCGNTGIGVLIADVIDAKFITSAYDQYGYEYVGIYATSMFPWNDMGYLWNRITPEYIEESIKPIVEELYSECPEFKQHVIWNNG